MLKNDANGSQHYSQVGIWKISSLTVALMLVVMGARYMTIQKWAVDLPYWDQWDGELAYMILPYLKGTISWSDFISPHNEHRILWSRLLSLGLFLENGQWDNLLEVTVNTFIQGLTAASLFLGGRAAFRSSSIYFWWIIVAVCLSLPFGFENTMMGFQSQFYMMGLFTILTVWMGTREKVNPRVKIVGLALLSFLLLFTMGAAFLCPFVLILALLIKAVISGRFLETLKSDIPIHITLGIAVIAGLLLVNHVPAHDSLKPDGVRELVLAIIRFFSWPWSSVKDSPIIQFGMAFLIWVPSLIFVGVLWWNRRAGVKSIDVFILALLGWVALQALSMAYSRGGGAAIPPVSRYADTLVFSHITNFLALWRVAFFMRHFALLRSANFVFALVWMVASVAGITLLTIKNVRFEIPHRSNNFAKQTENVAQFIRDDDENHLTGKHSDELPYPNTDKLIKLLRDPLTRQILPWSVREPIGIKPMAPLPNDCFAANGVPASFDQPAYEKITGSYSDELLSKGKGVYYGNFTLEPTLPYLAMKVSGYLQKNGSKLEVRYPSRKRLTLVANDRAAENWSMVYFKSREAGSYEIRASDKSVTRWLAFSEPREIGRLSVYARILLEQHLWFLTIGFGLLGVVVCSSALRSNLRKSAVS